MKNSLIRFTILSVFLIVAISMSVFYYTRTREIPRPLFLHIYSNRYDIYSMSSDLPPPPRPLECIATIAIPSTGYFYADLPNHYEPYMRIEGNMAMSGNLLTPNFTIGVEECGGGYSHHQTTPLALNSRETFGLDEEFFFAISDSQSPP